MKKYNRQALGCCAFVLFNIAGGVAPAYSATMNIATEPLYLGFNVDPNVFFELDDSGSMDWSITTVPYWDQCRYDKAHPSADNCSSSLQTNGIWRSYVIRYQESGNNWAIHNEFYANFAYVFDVDNDNKYGDWCTDSNTTIASCQIDYEYDGKDRRYRMAYTKDWRIYSSDFNVTFYNPVLTYQPWKATDLGNADFSAARSNPQQGQTGYSLKRDLADDNAMFPITGNGFVYEVWKDTHGYDSNDGKPNFTNRTDKPNEFVDVWDSHNRFVITSAGGGYVLTKYEVSYSLEDVAGDGINDKVLVEQVSNGLTVTTDGSLNSDGSARSITEIVQNIANWYQYGRRRMFVAKNAISRVVDENSAFRFGMTVLNKTGDGSDELFAEMPDRDDFDYSDNNRAMLESLYKFPQPAKGTPLRRGLDNAGRYFAHKTGYDDKQRTSPIIEACQQNFTLLFTDGYWNGSDPWTSVSDRDDDNIPKTLADVAKYWSDHDIDENQANTVPVPGSAGEHTFQHMVTYSVAFGVQGRLSDQSGNDNVPDKIMNFANNGAISFSDFDASAEGVRWGDNPFDFSTGKIDDMWHAAYNSGGEFISAKSPEELLEGLNSAMDSITDATGSSSSVAASTGMYQTGTAIFLARFNSLNWSGDIFKIGIESDNNGVLSIPDPSDSGDNTAWGEGAAAKLDDLVALNSGTGYDTKRQVLTYNPESRMGIPFRFPNNYTATLGNTDLTKTQISALIPNSFSTTDSEEIAENKTKGKNLVNYIRGDRSNEISGTDGEYRARDHVLGDIVESSPRYVSGPERFYPDSLENAEYSAFRQSQANRKPILYFGANDGMLHAVEAGVDTISISGDGERTVNLSGGGEEVFSYIPSAVNKNLHKLAKTDYSHLYYVNSTVSVNDAYVGGAWRTVLAGSLAAGGQGIYALDITQTTNMNENDADKIVLWEFNDSAMIAGIGSSDEDDDRVGADGDKHLGHSYSRPQIAKMHNGKWVAVFGNGYNSTDNDGIASDTGDAYLYIVDLYTGLLIKRIRISDGSSSIDSPNGLSTPTLVDLEGDYVVDYIYAGDIKGNMWKLDVTSTSTSGWTVEKLFAAGSDKPITVKPAVGSHPNGSGLMVFFGTGKYIEAADADPSTNTTQSFYAIWDNVYDAQYSLPVSESKLNEQTILNQVTHSESNMDVRVTSNDPIDWASDKGWFIDIKYNGNNYGELIATDPLLRQGRVVFISIQPMDDACAAGGDSWIWELDSASGQRLADSPVDVNGDGVIDSSDYVSHGGDNVSGGAFKLPGIMTMPTILADADNSGKEHKILTSSTGSTTEMTESSGKNMGRRSWRQLR